MSIRYYWVSLEELIPKLRRFFENRPEVLLAILFGSVTRRSLGGEACQAGLATISSI